MPVGGGDVRQLDSDELAGIYELMLTVRESEARTLELFKAGELQPDHVLPCLGQEAIPAGSSRVLQPSDDVIAGHRARVTISSVAAICRVCGPSCTGSELVS